MSPYLGVKASTRGNQKQPTRGFLKSAISMSHKPCAIPTLTLVDVLLKLICKPTKLASLSLYLEQLYWAPNFATRPPSNLVFPPIGSWQIGGPCVGRHKCEHNLESSEAPCLKGTHN